LTKFIHFLRLFDRQRKTETSKRQNCEVFEDRWGLKLGFSFMNAVRLFALSGSIVLLLLFFEAFTAQGNLFLLLLLVNFTVVKVILAYG